MLAKHWIGTVLFLGACVLLVGCPTEPDEDDAIQSPAPPLGATELAEPEPAPPETGSDETSAPPDAALSAPEEELEDGSGDEAAVASEDVEVQLINKDEYGYAGMRGLKIRLRVSNPETNAAEDIVREAVDEHGADYDEVTVFFYGPDADPNWTADHSFTVGSDGEVNKDF